MTAFECAKIITLILIILLLSVVYFIAIWKTNLQAIMRREWHKRARVIGTIFGLLVVIYLGFNLRDIQAHYWVLIMLYAGLVGVTVLYALSTHRLADVSREMAEVTKEQLLSEARPYLLLRLKDRVVQWNNIELDKHYPKEFQVIIHNAGKGPATNLYTALWHQSKSRFVCERKGYLVAGEEWEASISRFTALIEEKGGWLPKLRDIVDQSKTGIIAVECKDIHKRTWVSYLYLERHVSEDAFVTEGEQNIVELKNDD